MQAWLVTHFPMTDLGLFIVRTLVGLFFILARFRWVYDPAVESEGWGKERWFNKERQAHLVHKLEYCGMKNGKRWAPFVAYGELAGALGLIVGFLTPLAALGLAIILVKATICTGKEKTLRQNPIDKVDVVSCYLWNPEPVYLGLVIALMATGAGAWSLDHAFMSGGFSALFEAIGILTFVSVIVGAMVVNWVFPYKGDFNSDLWGPF